MTNSIKRATIVTLLSIIAISYAHAKLMTVNDKEKLNDILKKNTFVVLKFKARWCPACTKIQTPFTEIVKNFPDIIFVEIDFDKNKDIVKKYNIRGIPTILYIKNNNVIGKKVGTKSEEIFKINVKKDLIKYFGEKK